MLSIVVQFPLSIISTWVLGTGLTGFILSAVIAVLAGSLAYGAGIYAVGQQYIMNKIEVARCYRRVQWRLLSLLSITLMVAATILIGVSLAFLVIPLIAGLVFAVYWSVAQQASIIEGRKYLDALNRSLQLVRGEWWRVFGITMVFLILGFGLTTLLNLPFVIASNVVGSFGDSLLRFIGGLVAGTVVAPLLAIAWTLLYYDLRVRKEDYDLNVMSKELGLGPGS